MSTTTLVVLTVLEIVLFVAGLAFFLFLLGTLLRRIADNLEECAEHVGTIAGQAEVIKPGLKHINRSGATVAGALPLLYTFAERIVRNVTPRPAEPEEHVARPASGRRRSRLHEAVGYRPGGHSG
jgi:hypothetical protein